jgi:hypothetical protein
MLAVRSEALSGGRTRSKTPLRRPFATEAKPNAAATASPDRGIRALSPSRSRSRIPPASAQSATQVISGPFTHATEATAISALSGAQRNASVARTASASRLVISDEIASI